MSEPADFFEAVKRGDADQVADFVLSSPDLVRAAGEYAKTGLHWAAELDRIEIAKLLVEAGADIEAKTSWGASALDWAATMGSGRVAEYLLSLGASGYTLITAAAMGRLVDVERFVDSGHDLSAHRRRDAPPEPDDHWTPDCAHIKGDILSDALYAAARNGHTEVVEYLLERGADVDARGVFGATALQWAAHHGHMRTVELLVSRGADPTIRDARFDATAAGWAAENGHQQVAEYLERV